MNRYLIAVALLFLVGSPAEAQKILTTKDDFSGVSQVYTEGNGRHFTRERPSGVGAKQEEGDTRATIAVEMVRMDGETTKYSVLVNYSATAWMFIQDEKPMIFLLDGKKLELKPREVRREIVRGGVNEVATYDVSAEALRQIAQAKEIRFQIPGKTRNEAWRAKGKRTNFAKFVQKYVDQPAVPATARSAGGRIH